ncbi:Transcriptional activator hac1-like protein [Elsinoe fawcettii]|nr:Transcriptional activator hac1-like protein [Elsinoe fawcettii]
MEHISPQSLMTYSTHSSVSPDPMFPMDGLFCPPTHTLSVTKPVKKRKSWGQELPEPKTNLPPRKRAKTEDEKEQRRIERIKRNRAAAHNSRERKRQEAEGLAVANEKLVHTMKEMQRLIDVQAAQLKKCKEQLGGSLPEMSEEETEIFERRFSEQSITFTMFIINHRSTSIALVQQHAIRIQPRVPVPRVSVRFAQPDTTFCCNVVRPAVSVERSVQQSLGSVNVPNMGMDSDYTLFNPFERHDNVQDHTSGLMDSIANSNEQPTGDFDALFDFDTSSSSADYLLSNSTSQMVDFGAAPFACDGSFFG